MVQAKTVMLTTRTPRFVASEADLEREPEKTLTVPLGVFRAALGLAQTQGWRAPRRDFNPRDSAECAAAITEALARPALTPGVRDAHLTSFAQMRAVFDDPTRLKQLRRLVGFLEQGVGVDVSEG